ncbi:MAG: hemolysin family protein [Ferruginibacter sp.]
MDLIAFLAIIISLVFIGFLSGVEIAFISVNKLSIELNKKQGTYSGKLWSGFGERPARFIGTILVASNVLLVVYGLLVSDMLFPVWRQLEKWMSANFSSAAGYVKWIKLVFETVASTAIILLVEFLFKAYFRARNNSVLSNGIISYITSFFFWLFSSLANFFVGAAEWILKTVFNVRLRNRQETLSKTDLEQFMGQVKSASTEDESSEMNKELFDNALSLGEIRLRECLVPRKEIIAIEKNTSIEEIKKKFIETRLSKLVVFDKDIDSIVGYLHQLDLFKHPQTAADILLPIPMVPETMSATDLMNKFSKERKSIAWVVDEFGGTAGIVTMEDLLEEIFGDIKDEYDDVEEFVDKQLSENEFIFSGRMELDAITEKYGLEFGDENNAETLSGYIIENNGSIPREKERIIAGKYEFEAMSVSNTRIETVKVKKLR